MKPKRFKVHQFFSLLLSDQNFSFRLTFFRNGDLPLSYPPIPVVILQLVKKTWLLETSEDGLQQKKSEENTGQVPRRNFWAALQKGTTKYI